MNTLKSFASDDKLHIRGKKCVYNVCCSFFTDLGSKEHEITTGLSSLGLWDQQVLPPIGNIPSPTSQKKINGQWSRSSLVPRLSPHV